MTGEDQKGSRPRQREWMCGWGGLGLVSAGLLCALYLAIQAPREPSFQGKRLTTWLRDARFNFDSTPSQPLDHALDEMAPECFPYMLAMMRAKDSRLRLRLDAFIKKQQWLHLRLNPPLSYASRWDAARGFATLGTNAQPAVARLVQLLQNPDTVRESAYALAFVRTPDALDALQRALTNQSVLIRQEVIIPLSIRGSAGELLLPDLIARLEDSDVWVRDHAARALGILLKEPRSVVTALAARLKDRSTDVRRTAAVALGNFGRKAEPAAEALQEALRENDATYREAARNALNAISAAPRDP